MAFYYLHSIVINKKNSSYSFISYHETIEFIFIIFSVCYTILANPVHRNMLLKVLNIINSINFSYYYYILIIKYKLYNFI